MKRPVYLCLLLCFITILFNACKKSAPSGAAATVYVSGYIGTLGIGQGAFWTNDSVQINSAITQYNGVVVADNSVYLLDNVGYWINGNYTALPYVINTFTKSMVISGSDVYVVGNNSTSNSTATAAAIYWKNGQEVDLTQNIPNVTNAFTTGLFVSGTDVYVSGILGVNYGNPQGVYWKNGNLVYLPDCYMPAAIGVVGSTVYVAGQSLTQGNAYWVNGKETLLSGNAYVNAMTVSGNDVYVAGYTAYGPDQACYWKNGQLDTLTQGWTATGITVSGNDVYVCGDDNNGDAVYWKNGVKHILGNGGATGIAVGK